MKSLLKQYLLLCVAYSEDLNFSKYAELTESIYHWKEENLKYDLDSRMPLMRKIMQVSSELAKHPEQDYTGEKENILAAENYFIEDLKNIDKFPIEDKEETKQFIKGQIMRLASMYKLS